MINAKCVSSTSKDCNSGYYIFFINTCISAAERFNWTICIKITTQVGFTVLLMYSIPLLKHASHDKNP